MLKKIIENFKSKKLDSRNFDYEVQIKKTKRLKTISLTVRDKNVIICCPYWTTENKIKKLILAKENWIKKIINIQSERENIININKNNGNYLFKGKTIKLRLKKSLNTSLKYIQNCILICTADFSNENINKLLSQWFRSQAKIYIGERLQFYSEVMNVRFSDLIIKSYKARWGSCDSRSKISINWRLIMAPKSVLDYVVIHELSHISYPNHSKFFWRHVRKYKPNFESDKRWLKKNGFILNSQII